MKKITAWALAALIAIPTIATAQTFTFSTNTSPGLTISTNPFGAGVGVTTPYFNTVYTTDGYYDAYGRYHRRPHHKGHRHCRGGKAHRKAMKKARKAYRKEMKKQYKKAYKHRHHHDDDDD